MILNPEKIQKHQQSWIYRGQKRPSFAIEPTAGQESCWDYPRPPRLENDQRSVKIETHDGILIGKSVATLRLLETAQPPVIYMPPSNIEMVMLVEIPGKNSFCEWKGVASYWALHSKPNIPVAWSYHQPLHGYERLKDYIAFYPDRVKCLLGGETVRHMDSKFYGGWITNEVVGPFRPGWQ